jgi:hypothetical protein
VTPKWEQKFDLKNVEEVKRFHGIIERVMDLCSPVNNLVISNVTIELHYTDIIDFVKSTFSYHSRVIELPYEKHHMDDLRWSGERTPYLVEVSNFYRIVSHHTEGNKITLFEFSKAFINTISKLIAKWEAEEEEREKELHRMQAEENKKFEEIQRKKAARLENALADYNRLSWWQKLSVTKPTYDNMEEAE